MPAEGNAIEGCGPGTMSGELIRPPADGALVEERAAGDCRVDATSGGVIVWLPDGMLPEGYGPPDCGAGGTSVYPG